ncbi:uncharacterized protein L201_006419 [Kwoniella dendrophila CBS 6074]|uniref:FAD-binding domain-containing protein n=1 Tax=Kwoniella dendrophila CBS 6074 TaxID=1295534 RepID=A0AAX4K2Z2_9TREE
MAVINRVLIIGGGLSGPCLSLSLAKYGIKSTIFEIRDKGPSESGGSISLGPDALRILDKYAGIYDKLKETGFTYTKMTVCTEDGCKLGHVQIGQQSINEKGIDEGYPAIRILRTKLHEVFLNTIEEQKHLIDIQNNKSIIRIEESDNGVIAHFKDGSTAEGDILIGSDGIHSKVREHILGSKAPKPIFTKTCVVNGFLPFNVAKKPNEEFEFPSFNFTPSGIFMSIPIDSQSKTLSWGITTSLDTELNREELNEFEISGRAIKLAKEDFKDYDSEPIRSLLGNVDETKAKVWAPYYIPTLETWHTSRTCLIGDAAHALPPNGQGTSVAFQDAALLTRLLLVKQNKDEIQYNDLFEKFEQLRKPEIKRIAGNGKPTQALKTKTGPWIWYLKKWAFWGYFTWNRGVLNMNKGHVYDVDKVDLEL